MIKDLWAIVQKVLFIGEEVTFELSLLESTIYLARPDPIFRKSQVKIGRFDQKSQFYTS